MRITHRCAAAEGVAVVGGFFSTHSEGGRGLHTRSYTRSSRMVPCGRVDRKREHAVARRSATWSMRVAWSNATPLGRASQAPALAAAETPLKPRAAVQRGRGGGG